MALKKIKTRELGFGSNTAENNQRFMNPDGSPNVVHLNDNSISVTDIFHRLTTMKWSHFVIVVIMVYFVANCIFGGIYLAMGIDKLGLKPTGVPWIDFMEAFFFSTQVFTTVGFGRVAPHDLGTNVVASIESMAGLMTFALATGLLYGRFSRPQARLVHSENLLISPYRGDQVAAMFRIASARRNSMLMETSVSVSLGMNRMEDGVLRRRFYVLELELDKINFLTLSWTLVHPINSESPLWGMDKQEIEASRAEFIVLFKGIEETTSQTTYERFSYFYTDIEWAARFIPVIGADAEGRPALRIKDIGTWEPAPLPENKELKPTRSTQL